MAQGYGKEQLSTNAGPSVTVDLRRYVPHEYRGAGRGWVPLTPEPTVERVAPGQAPRPQTEVYSDANIPDPFMPGEITPAKEVEWAWWTQITENVFPEGEPEDWGVDMGKDWAEVFVDPVTEDERFQAELANGSVDTDGSLPERDREVLARTKLFLDSIQPAPDHAESDPTGVIIRTPRPDKHTKRSVRLGQEEDHRHLRLAIASKARDFIKIVKASGEKIREKKPTRRPLLKAWQHVRLDRGQSLRPLRSSGAGVDNLDREASRGEVVRFLRTQERSQLRQEPLIARATYQALEQPLGPWTEVRTSDNLGIGNKS